MHAIFFAEKLYITGNFQFKMRTFDNHKTLWPKSAPISIFITMARYLNTAKFNYCFVLFIRLDVFSRGWNQLWKWKQFSEYCYCFTSSLDQRVLWIECWSYSSELHNKCWIEKYSAFIVVPLQTWKQPWPKLHSHKNSNVLEALRLLFINSNKW